MDKEMKPPYLPPKDRLIGEKEILASEKLNKGVQGEIKIVIIIIYFRTLVAIIIIKKN
jgi:hypothetical protein